MSEQKATPKSQLRRHGLSPDLATGQLLPLAQSQAQGAIGDPVVPENSFCKHLESMLSATTACKRPAQFKRTKNIRNTQNTPSRLLRACVLTRLCCGPQICHAHRISSNSSCAGMDGCSICAFLIADSKRAATLRRLGSMEKQQLRLCVWL